MAAGRPPVFHSSRCGRCHRQDNFFLFTYLEYIIYMRTCVWWALPSPLLRSHKSFLFYAPLLFFLAGVSTKRSRTQHNRHKTYSVEVTEHKNTTRKNATKKLYFKRTYLNHSCGSFWVCVSDVMSLYRLGYEAKHIIHIYVVHGVSSNFEQSVGYVLNSFRLVLWRFVLLRFRYETVN